MKDGSLVPAWAFALTLRRDHAAKLLDVSAGHFDKLVKCGMVPKPMDLGGVKVWRRSDLEDVVARLGMKTSGWGPVR